MPQVAAWLAAQAEEDLCLSVVTLGEIERGIRRQEGRDPGFAGDLRVWLDRTVSVFADRILPFDAEDAMIWAARRSGSPRRRSDDRCPGTRPRRDGRHWQRFRFRAHGRARA